MGATIPGAAGGTGNISSSSRSNCPATSSSISGIIAWCDNTGTSNTNSSSTSSDIRNSRSNSSDICNRSSIATATSTAVVKAATLVTPSVTARAAARTGAARPVSGKSAQTMATPDGTSNNHNDESISNSKGGGSDGGGAAGERQECPNHGHPGRHQQQPQRREHQ